MKNEIRKPELKTTLVTSKEVTKNAEPEKLINLVGEWSRFGTPARMAAFSALESLLHEVKVRISVCKKHAKGDELKFLEKLQSML